MQPLCAPQISNQQFLQDGIPHLSYLSSICRSFQAQNLPFPPFDFDSPDMQRSAFIVALLSFFAFCEFFARFLLKSTDRGHFFAVVSLTLASPLPVQVVKEMRETTVEPSARELPVDHKVLNREVIVHTESSDDLHILAREHETFEDYVQEARVPPLLIACTRLT